MPIGGIGDDRSPVDAERACRLDDRIEIGLGARRHDDRRPLARERVRDRATDTSAATGHDRHPTVELAHVRTSVPAKEADSIPPT